MSQDPNQETSRVPLLSRHIRVGGWLPGSLTLGNLLAGYAAILLASRGELFIAGCLIFAAGVLDGLDGRLARLTGTTSDFGEQFDSLADAISFAVAPSVLAFNMGLSDLGRPGWGVCFLFAACGAIRLARFTASASENSDFVGMPSPTGAAVVTCPAIVLAGPDLPEWGLPVYAAVLGLTALLMVSKIPYRSPKNISFGDKPYRKLALLAAIVAGLIIRYEWVVPGLLAAYLLSPIYYTYRARRASPGE